MRTNKLLNRSTTLNLWVFALTILMWGCGGGGSSGSTASPVPTSSSSSSATLPPAAPTVTLSFATKQIVVGWNTVGGATRYRVLKNTANASGYSAISGDLNTNTFTDLIGVHVTDWVNASYKVQACNSAGCTESGAIFLLPANSIQATGYIKASNTGAGDLFGYSTALSGDGATLVVGASGEASHATGVNGDQTGNTYPNSGAAYIFVRNSMGNWVQEAYIKASNLGSSNFFGTAVALSNDGNTLAIGATGESSNATGINGNQMNVNAPSSGAVYVFVRTGNTWSQQAYVKASNTKIGDRFGSKVFLSNDGNTLAVSALEESSGATGINGNQADNSVTGSGAVYVFLRTNTIWSQQSYIKASNTEAQDFFGHSIALSSDGTTLAIGASGEDSGATGINGNQLDNTEPASGATYVFVRSGSGWTQQAYIKASDPGAADYFGSSIALTGDGNTLAVGANGEASNATGINGNQANNSLQSSGAAYIFVRSSAGNWAQEAYIKASNTDADDRFGFNVVLSGDGNTLVVASWFEDSRATGINDIQTDNSTTDSGVVYAFARTGSTWKQTAYIKASNTDIDDSFGYSVALSSDGKTLAVGGVKEDSSAIGVGGNQADNSTVNSGSVYLY